MLGSMFVGLLVGFLAGTLPIVESEWDALEKCFSDGLVPL